MKTIHLPKNNHCKRIDYIEDGTNVRMDFRDETGELLGTIRIMDEVMIQMEGSYHEVFAFPQPEVVA